MTEDEKVVQILNADKDLQADVLVRFKRTVIGSGTSNIVTIPPELTNFLDIDKGDKVIMIGDQSTKGRFIAFWKEDTNNVRD